MVVGQFTTGHANLTYLLEFGTLRLVLRRPPRGRLASGAHDMHREYRVLSRLNAVYPRAPYAPHFSDDIDILGAPFVIIEFRDGEVVGDTLPASMAHHPDVERRLDLALIDAAADLHTLDVTTVGLADLGRPDGFGDRQVAGWTRRWDRVSSDGQLPLMERVAQRLARTVPPPPAVSIVHNDLKLDNCQFDPADPDTVTSVFDWDMATIGDPLFDIGSLLVSMGRSPLWVLSDDEALGRYEKRSGINVGHIDWYVAFAVWRTAVVVRQLAHRYESGDSADDRLAGIGAAIGDFAERAWDLLSR
ncbi:phosphotransferase family protein [Frankia sp. CNm7]|nr:phosphotransferase family protein [Frankia nepalensis]MBL7514609.1 phosphotransferase family protein [Frankia nepalensis]MBL7524305.1 phosphotransferase family protein [Frankia nepalensis]